MASTSEPHRTIHVPARRFRPWVAGFEARHGGARRSGSDVGLTLVGQDGDTAEIVLPFLPWSGQTLDDADRHLAQRRRVLVLIVRRGGYVVASAAAGSSPEVVEVKRSTRRVQGRTAAGGWSQQRYARRRGRQTDELVDAAAASVVQHHRPDSQWLLTGGDRALIDAVLGDLRVAALPTLPRLEHLGQVDPDRRTVDELPDLIGRLTIRLRP